MNSHLPRQLLRDSSPVPCSFFPCASGKQCQANQTNQDLSKLSLWTSPYCHNFHKRAYNEWCENTHSYYEKKRKKKEKRKKKPLNKKPRSCLKENCHKGKERELCFSDNQWYSLHENLFQYASSAHTRLPGGCFRSHFLTFLIGTEACIYLAFPFYTIIWSPAWFLTTSLPVVPHPLPQPLTTVQRDKIQRICQWPQL